MIVTQLPNPHNYSNASQQETGNVVISAITRDKYYYPAHQTPYLLVTNYISTGSYLVNNQPTDINDKYFYFLQAGSKLEIDFTGNAALQTLLVLFNSTFITEAMHENTATDKQLLDDPFYTGIKDVYIPPVPFCINKSMQRLLMRFKSSAAMDEGQFTFLLLNIINQFCLLNDATKKQIGNIRAVKKSTREELYKRLFMAKLFMEENIHTPITIEDIAKEACLNSFHFLRSFKQAHGTTPHQFLSQLRLLKAFDLLSYHNYTVTETCAAVGFESTSSFSNLFKKRFGVAPSALLK